MVQGLGLRAWFRTPTYTLYAPNSSELDESIRRARDATLYGLGFEAVAFEEETEL